LFCFVFDVVDCVDSHWYSVPSWPGQPMVITTNSISFRNFRQI
jgi:hypothetical protein